MTILNTFEVLSFVGFACIFIGSIVGVVFLIALIINMMEDNQGIAVLCALLTFIMVLVIIAGLKQPKETRYEILVNDTAIFEQYEVIEQRGKIFTVKEQDNSLEK